MVERDLAKVDVAGSTPVSRSKMPVNGQVASLVVDVNRPEISTSLKRRGTQVVRERSAKPLCAGSIPARASNSLNNLA